MPACLDAFSEADGVVEAAQFGQAVQHVLFFHVVRTSPNSMIRVAVEGETGFETGDIVVAPHRALHVQGRKRQVIVDSMALEWLNQEQKQPFVLSLASFSCDELASICKWQSGEKLVFGFWGSSSVQARQLSANDPQVLPSLLEELLPSTSEQGYKLDARDPTFQEKHSCLCALDAAGLARKLSEDERFSTWCMTEHGVSCGRIGCQLGSPSHALAIRDDVELSERSVWELMVLLDHDGWQHKVKDKGPEPPYRADADNKVWFSRPGDDSISFPYLLCLAQGHAEIPHFQSAAFYQGLSEGKAPVQRVRKIARAIRHINEEDWEAGALASVEARVKRPRQARRRQVRAIADALEVDGDALPDQNLQEANGLHDEDSSDHEHDDFLDGVNDGEHVNAAEHVPPTESQEIALNASAAGALSSPEASLGDRTPPTPESSRLSDHDVGPPSSENSSSSSLSSSSSSSDVSAPPGAVVPVARARRAKAKAKAGAARANNPRASFYYGMGHAVRTYKNGQAVGWEMSCNHPAHKRCRKNLKSTTRARTAEQTLHMLKIWLLRGRHLLTADDHMNDAWSEVQRDAALELLEPLPENPPLDYTAEDGTVKQFQRNAA